MKFNITIPNGLNEHYLKEIEQYRSFLQKNDLTMAWYHHERSHVLGQSYPFQHTYSHWLMLKFGFRQKKFEAVFGQLLRLLVGGWKSFIDRVPIGNTGGSNVPPMQKMEMSRDLTHILNHYRKS
jgi:hypothetical protein